MQEEDNDNHMITELWLNKTEHQQAYNNVIKDGRLELFPKVNITRTMRKITVDKDGELKSGHWIPSDNERVPEQYRKPRHDFINCNIEHVSALLKYDVRPEPYCQFTIDKRESTINGNRDMEFSESFHPIANKYLDTGIEWLRSFSLVVTEEVNLGRLHKGNRFDECIILTYKLYENKIDVCFKPTMIKLNDESPGYYPWITFYNEATLVINGVYNGDDVSGYAFSEIGGEDHYRIIESLITDTFKKNKDNIVGFIHSDKGYSNPYLNKERLAGYPFDGGVAFNIHSDSNERKVFNIYKDHVELMYKNTLYFVIDKLYLNGTCVDYPMDKIEYKTADMMIRRCIQGKIGDADDLFGLSSGRRSMMFLMCYIKMTFQTVEFVHFDDEVMDVKDYELTDRIKSILDKESGEIITYLQNK